MDALEIGITDEQFAAMCMRELFRHFVVAKRKRIRESDRDKTLAWYGVVMELASYVPHNKKGHRKPPNLLKFLHNDDGATEARRDQMNAKQVKGMIFALAAQYGGTVRMDGQVIMQVPQRRVRRKK